MQILERFEKEADKRRLYSVVRKNRTTEITRTNDTQGFIENKEAAIQGGKVAGNARKELESKTGKKVISNDN